MIKKLSDQSGETLAELLVSILIGGLSTLMLLTSVNASASMNQKTLQSDETFYTELTAAERGTALPDQTITMQLTENGREVASFEANLQGETEAGLLSYSLEGQP